MGRSSRAKRERRQRKPLFIDIESRMVNSLAFDEWAQMDASQLERAQLHAGKAATFSMMYGGTMSGQWGSHRSSGRGMGRLAREHPLEFQPGYHFIEFDKRFGNAPVYKVNTKEIGDHMRHGELIVDTQVYVSRDGFRALQPELMLGAVCWIRRAKLEDIKTACAFLLMLDRQPVILRAFEP